MSGLVVDAVSLTLGGALVLDDVSMAFRSGRVTAVLGPNGAGKTTLMACLAGLRLPDRGAITLDGVAREKLGRRAVAQRIGYLPQTANVHWDVDVQTLVSLGRFPHRGRWGESDADRAAVERAIAATDIGGFSTRAVNSLSGGERARVLLARVLAGEPEWLLADEPLANLDPAHQLDGLDCLRAAAAAGAGVVVVLHDLNHAARVADEVVLMKAGRVTAQGTPDVVLTPALIGETFGVRAHVGTTPEGHRFIVTTHRRDVA